MNPLFAPSILIGVDSGSAIVVPVLTRAARLSMLPTSCRLNSVAAGRTTSMGSRRLYLSFDFDHDDELRGSFLAQARRHSPHSIVDCSLPAAVDGNWTRVARRRIAQAHVVVFICGENTHSAKGVEAEMTLTRQLRKRYFLLKGRRYVTCSKPRNAYNSDVIHDWSWTRINRLLAHSL